MSQSICESCKKPCDHVIVEARVGDAASLMPEIRTGHFKCRRCGRYLVSGEKIFRVEHYVCTGNCGGISDIPGKCQAQNCLKYNQPLEKCDCVDNKHNGRQLIDEHGESGAVGELENFVKK